MIRKLTASIAFTALIAAACGSAEGLEPREVALEPAPQALLRVGPERELVRPSDAAKLAHDGDIIEIDAGLYDGDATVWTQHNLTIRGRGGRAHLRAKGSSAEDKAIWVIKGNNTVVESVEFSGATVRYRNGAGIRQEGAGLTLRDCYFHHNENGILTGANPSSDIVIEHSEFAYNGFGDGYSHNLYIGTVKSFTLRFSYVHHAVVGHNVKSRALTTDISYNQIADGSDGRSSYAIDLPNGGISHVLGNIIQQGPATENTTIVFYGAEGLKNPVNELYFVNNTVVNDFAAGGRFVVVRTGADTVRLVNNVFLGAGEVLTGPGELQNNLRAAKTDFVDPDRFDYRIKFGSAAIRGGIDPGRANGFDLRPLAEYVHPLQKRLRGNSSTPDLGALEFRSE